MCYQVGVPDRPLVFGMMYCIRLRANLTNVFPFLIVMIPMDCA
jgi:hypothetical protein